jgi:hypothetical protein
MDMNQSVWGCTKQYRHATLNQEWNFCGEKKTKPIKVKFFFIKGIVDNGEIKVVDCPTEEMWAGILTILLHSMAFRMMRSQLMNCLINYEDMEQCCNSLGWQLLSRSW